MNKPWSVGTLSLLVVIYSFARPSLGVSAEPSDPPKLMADWQEEARTFQGVFKACFENPYAVPSEYTTLTYQNALVQMDRLIARQHKYVETWKACSKDIRSRVDSLNRRFTEVVEVLMRLSDPQSKETADALAKIASKLASISKVIDSVMHLHVELEHLFRDMKQHSPRDLADIIVMPKFVDDLERGIVRNLRHTNDAMVDQLEVLYKLYPSTKLEARLGNAKITQILVQAIDILMESITSDGLHGIEKAHQHMQLAIDQADQLAHNGAILKPYPEAEEHYRMVIEDLTEPVTK